MSSRKGIFRLQVILIIDLIVVASAAAGYFYVSSLPEPMLTSSQVQLMDLQAIPATALIGQDIAVSVNVTNIAGSGGTYSAVLMVDGAQNQEKSVSLAAGETKTVEFTISGAAEGTHIVALDNLQASFVLSSPIELSNLAINRTQAQIGEPIGITVNVANIANHSESYSVALLINGATAGTKTDQLDGGAATSLLFEVTEPTEGAYQVSLGNLNGSFLIAPSAPPATPADFNVSSLSISPAVAQPGVTVTVSAKVTNVGELSGSYTATLTVNGQASGSKDLQLSGGETATVSFTITETVKGTYIIALGNATATLSVQDPSKITVSSLSLSSPEVWGGDTLSIGVKATNTGTSPSSLEIKVKQDGEAGQIQTVTLAGGTFISVQLTTVAPALQGGDSATHTIDVNGLTATFTVVKTNYHTLSVNINPAGNADFTITLPSGAVEPHKTPYSAILPVGTYTVSMPAADPTGKATFVSWSDRITSLSRTFPLNMKVSLVADFSVGASCPSLFMWNGTTYTYVADVSNHGWLGYINTINNDGTITYFRNTPWDYIPLDSSQLKATNGYYNLTLLQRYNEVFYTDKAYMVVVDHPAAVNVYSTMEEQYLDPNYMGKLYTVSNNMRTPISAVNERGENVLPQISTVDGVFTSGSNGLLSPAWNNITWGSITLNLGNLTGTQQTKLVVRAIVNWGSPDDYSNWLNQFFAQSVPNGTQVTPPPFMEVKNAQGNWVRIPDSRQFPLPPDSNPRTYVIDLTGLFPTKDYSLRISNFWNVTFDYIGVDTSPQQAITTQVVYPQAYLYQNYTAGTEAPTGSFTKYGNVTPLILTEDDMFVIGRQGDALSLQFPTANLAPPAAGMVRDYFIYEATWFKDSTGNWGFGFGFTVDPLPFRTMSGFPYPPTESYPNDTAHQNYMQQWNTRVYAAPTAQNSISNQNFAAALPSFAILSATTSVAAAACVALKVTTPATRTTSKLKRTLTCL
jgi:hypothetical protein